MPALDQALDRMLLLLRFFRLGDGALAVFGGGGEDDARIIAALLAQDQRQDQRVDASARIRASTGSRWAGRSSCSMPARRRRARSRPRAHAGCLSFEMSSGAHRLVVNCGAFAGHDRNWQRALRSTPAHSTLTLDERSQATVLARGTARAPAGPAPVRRSDQRRDAASRKRAWSVGRSEPRRLCRAISGSCISAG